MKTHSKRRLPFLSGSIAGRGVTPKYCYDPIWCVTFRDGSTFRL